MKIVVEVSEKDYLAFCLQFDNGILEETVPSHRAKIAIANGTPLPEGVEILTAEAYSDLCLRASQESILDKIRAEIEFEVDHRTNMLCAEDVLEIIDKYKEESEDNE